MKKKVVKRERDKEVRPNELDKMIMNELQKLWWKWPPRNEVKFKARKKVPDGFFKNGNTKFVFKFECVKCKELHDKVDINHIEPRICIETGFVSLDDWSRRTFCGVDNLETLCKNCHKILTSADATERAKHRRGRKEGK